MNVEITVPSVPSDYTDNDETLIICDLYVNENEFVYKDTRLFDVEAKNVVLEVVAPVSGTIHSIKIEIGQKVVTGIVVMQADPTTKEPLLKKLYRIINIEFLSGLLIGSIITYAILKMV